MHPTDYTPTGTPGVSLDWLARHTTGAMLRSGLFGVEREALRVTADGTLAQTPHPAAFGDKLTHPTITVDFSESQVEMVTPPQTSVAAALRSLADIQQEVESVLARQGEFLWPLSMPPALPDPDRIPIARFDDTPAGRQPGLTLFSPDGEKPLPQLARPIFSRLLPLARLMDRGLPHPVFADAVRHAWRQLVDPSLLPSAQIHRAMARARLSHHAYGVQLLKPSTALACAAELGRIFRSCRAARSGRGRSRRLAAPAQGRLATAVPEGASRAMVDPFVIIYWTQRNIELDRPVGRCCMSSFPA